MNTYLFPDLSPETDEVIVPQVPVLHAETRQKLYRIVTLLCKRSDSNLYRVMEQLEDVVPRGMFSLKSPVFGHGCSNVSTQTIHRAGLMTDQR